MVMKRYLAASIVAGIALLASSGAMARVDVGIGIGIPGVVVAAPPPVYYEPEPVYVAPQPVVVAPGYYDDWRAREWQRRQWREQKWREHEWRERRREWHRWHEDEDD